MILIVLQHQPRTGIGSELLDSVTLKTINDTVFSVL
jgi:hypothetical protein